MRMISKFRIPHKREASPSSRKWTWWSTGKCTKHMAKGAAPSSCPKVVNTTIFLNIWISLREQIQHLPLEKTIPHLEACANWLLYFHTVWLSHQAYLIFWWLLQLWTSEFSPKIYWEWWMQEVECVLSIICQTCTPSLKANIRWIVGNPYGGHWSSFGTPEASHTCLTILVPKYLTHPQPFLDMWKGLIWCSQEYHSDEAQMVVELQMMVDTVVDLSCNTLSGPLESANLLLLLPARTQHQSFCL
jgi:hypothetical protein